VLVRVRGCGALSLRLRTYPKSEQSVTLVG
jgi:hypothetical protein